MKLSEQTVLRFWIMLLGLSVNLFQFFGGNRCGITLGCGVATTLLCFLGKINGEVYAMVTIATVGAYIAGRTTQSVKEIDAGSSELRTGDHG